MKTLFRTLIMLLVVFSGPKSMAGNRTLDATFIQFQGGMMKNTDEMWIKDLTAMRDAGMKTLVIQYAKYEDTRFFPINVDSADPFETIFKFADANGMKIMMGLAFSEQWWKNWNNQFWLFDMVLHNQRMAQSIFKRYGSHPSFSGWYIPYETSDDDFDDYQIDNLNYMIRALSTVCKLSSGPQYKVAMSTFFTGKLKAKDIEKIYRRIFAKTGLDILMIQDGVGERASYRNDVAGSIVPALKAYAAAAGANGAETWGVAESFVQNDKSERHATSIELLEKQLNAHEAASMAHIMTFDFYHYMAPSRGPEQAKLNADYMTLKQLREQRLP